MSRGEITALVGCMSSGKSGTLIVHLKKAAYVKNRRLMLFKHTKDSRSGDDTVVSRDGKSHKAIAVNNAQEILDRASDLPEKSVVGIDEVQFFDDSLVHVVQALANRGIVVFFSGLDTDFRGEPFRLTAMLMSRADKVERQDAVCMVCGERATLSQRLIDGQPAPYDSETIAVGGDEMYEARCYNCHVVPR